MQAKEGYFVIMVSALVLGSQNGFVIGAITALVSNIFLGQGPWTPWQMYAWGMVGLSVGAMRHTLFMKNKWLRMLYGLAIGYFFGWFMNLWAILGSNLPLTWLNIFDYGVSSFFFDLAHGLSNVFFLGIFALSWIQTIRRFKEKYGLFPEIS